MQNTPSASAHRKIDKKLGQLLVEKGRITGEQLIRAIQSQRALGGRIGTCLLEMEVLGEDELLQALEEQLRVSSAGVDELRVIDASVLNLVPGKMAARFEAVPFAADDKELHIATLHVRHLAFLDELRYLTNRTVVPHIANEVRIFEALQKHYRVELPKRYGHLLDRLNRTRYMWDESAKVLLGAESPVDWTDPDEAFGERSPAARAAAGKSTPRSSNPSQGTAGVSPSNASAVPQSRRRASGADTWPAGVLSLDQVDRLLENEGDPQRVAEAVVRFAAQSFTRTALFKVQKNNVYGWLARGEGIDRKLFMALELSLGEPSLFLNLAKGTTQYLGPLPPMPIHRRMACAWGGDFPSECLMLPIRVREHLVSVLYGDRGPLGLLGVDVEVFQRLRDRASEALELCVLRKKIKTA
ncbi:MAG: hypothetical protein MPN21_08340 [Thermoanaerobaculia bacterium]|nr:hypothetical protein [Thermoanaerobaculia bacterium]